MFVLCELPTLKNPLANSDKNKLIDYFNELLLEKFDNDSSGFRGLQLNQIISNTPNSNGNLQDYNQLLHDKVHLNYSRGVPMLNNLLLSYLLRTSSCLVNASSKMYNNAVYNIGPTNNGQASPMRNIRNPFINPDFYKHRQIYSYFEPYLSLFMFLG